MADNDMLSDESVYESAAEADDPLASKDGQANRRDQKPRRKTRLPASYQD